HTRVGHARNGRAEGGVGEGGVEGGPSQPRAVLARRLAAVVFRPGAFLFAGWRGVVRRWIKQRTAGCREQQHPGQEPSPRTVPSARSHYLCLHLRRRHQYSGGVLLPSRIAHIATSAAKEGPWRGREPVVPGQPARGRLCPATARFRAAPAGGRRGSRRRPRRGGRRAEQSATAGVGKTPSAGSRGGAHRQKITESD